MQVNVTEPKKKLESTELSLIDEAKIDFCSDWDLEMHFRINKNDVLDTSNEFGDCYQWNGTDVLPNQKVYHLVVFSEEHVNN